MTIARALSRGGKLFGDAGCDTPRLDALVLLAAAAGRDKPWLFALDGE
jgi:hypothetical protein